MSKGRKQLASQEHDRKPSSPADSILKQSNIPLAMFNPSLQEFWKERRALQLRVEDTRNALAAKEISVKEKEAAIANLERGLSAFKVKEQIGFLSGRVKPEAEKMLIASEAFRQQFFQKECTSFVMAVDIRRSTDLMLKARTPEAFVRFIIDLSSELIQIITDAYGVFDKFTGDGILSFFPEFYSGSDAAYYVIRAANQCHMAFDRLYQASRKSFSSVLKGIGLGIGIDFGQVHLLDVGGGLTVVGEPVVYACRFSGAPSGLTLLNQRAYEIVSERYSSLCFIREAEIEIKHEGSMLAYDVRLGQKKYSPAVPVW